jgi:hypothetical protein
MEQHSPEWWSARCAKVTASRIGDIMARTQKGAYTAARGHYLKEKVAERITGKPRDRKKVASLDARLDLEPDARAAYEFYYDTTIELVGFIDHPRIPNAGCSPDGLVLPKGGTEIKCCDAEAHLEIFTAEVIDPKYFYQCHFSIDCTDSDWWDFVAFNPEMPEELKLYVKRIERDDQIIAQMESAIIEFNEEVERKVQEVQSRMRGSTPLTAALECSLESLGVH